MDNHRNPTRLLDLPPEVIIHILSYLDVADTLSISCVNTLLRNFLQTSQVLRYHFAAQVTGVETNLSSKLGIAERLRVLNKREAGWAQFQADFSKTIPITHDAGGIYDLSGGVYLTGDVSRKKLHYCTLPSSPDETMTWNRIHIDSTQSIVDVGLALYEHNLIAVVTSKPIPARPSHTVVEVQLLEFSTGNPHPLARTPVLFVREGHEPDPSSPFETIGIEVVGEYLALITTPNRHERTGRFCVFEWKTGSVILDLPVEGRTYCSVMFLSPTHILAPHASNATFDIFALPPSNPSSPSPILRLSLPTLRDTFGIYGIYGRAEMNPMPSGTPHSTAPFHPSPQDAIAIFNIHIRNDDGATAPWGDFSLFVHRSTLLRLCLDAEAEVERDGRSGSLAAIAATVVKEWDDWGPRVTRWIDKAISPWWITTTCGQRAVLSVTVEARELGEPAYIQLMDFNPLFIKKVLAEQATRPMQKPTEGVPYVVRDVNALHHWVFKRTVVNSLPYVSNTRFANEEILFDFDGVLMDEERLLGLRSDEEGKMLDIQVWHMGAD